MNNLNSIVDYLKVFNNINKRPAYEPRTMAHGGSAGQLVQNTADGSRPGYQGPTKGHKQEKIKFLNWLENNKDFDFANSSTAEIMKKSKTKFKESTIQTFLGEKEIKTKHSIARAQAVDYTPEMIKSLEEGLPKGLSLEIRKRPGGVNYYYQIMLRGKKVNKPDIKKSFVATPENKEVAIEFLEEKSKKYYPNRISTEKFKELRNSEKYKNLTTEEFSKVLNKKKYTTYLGESFNNSSVSKYQVDTGLAKTVGPITYRTVDEAKAIIRQYSGGKLFLRTNPTDTEITQWAANKISQEKTIAAKGKHFPFGGTKENKMFYNFYESSEKSDGRMQLKTKTPIDENGEINWKMKDKNGVHAWKKAKFYDTKTGETFTWLDKKGNYKPGDLRKQVDAAYHEGFFNKSTVIYDEQAKWNKKTFGGKALNEWMREGLLKKELELKLKRKLTSSAADKELLKDFYTARKPSYSFTEAHHIEGVGKNPFRMELSYRAANRAQNSLQSSYNAGTISRAEYIKGMENLSDTKGGIKYKTEGRFVGQTGTPERIVATGAKEAGLLKNKDFVKFFKGTFQGLSPQSVLQMGRTHGCLKKDEGGSIMSCLQTKFEKNPDKFLQKSAPLAKDNVNLFKWFKNGRKIARGTGVFAAWEAAFAPIIAGWSALEGESNQRIINEIAYGIPFIGETKKDEWMKYAGGDENAYTAKRIDEISQQELPYLQQQKNQVINKMSNVPGKGPQQRFIETDIKEKQLELQGYLNTPEFYEGPAGSYVNEAVVGDAFSLADATTKKIAADMAERKKQRFDWLEKNKLYANQNWQSQVQGRADGGIMGLKKKW